MTTLTTALALKPGFRFKAISYAERVYIHGAAAHMGGYIAVDSSARMMMEKYFQDEDGYPSSHVPYLALLPEDSEEGTRLDSTEILNLLQSERDFWAKCGYTEDVENLQLYIDIATGKQQSLN
jgi:hypothetical protein